MPKILKNIKFDARKIPARYHQGITKLLYALGIDGNEFIDDFIYSYLDYAFAQSDKKNDVYTSTGFGRRYINNYLNQVKSKTRPLKNIYHKSLIAQLMKYAESTKDGVLPIYGKQQSFNAAFNLIKQPEDIISAKSMIDKLVRVGVLERVDKKFIRFVTAIPDAGLNAPDDVIRNLTTTMNRLCNTLHHNMNVPNNDDGLIQISRWTDDIALENHELCKALLREETRNYATNCANILRSLEEKGHSKQTTDGTKIEIGMSVFIFNNKK